MKIHLHKNDLPNGIFENSDSIAVDSETTGLLPYRDRLCLVQMSDGGDNIHLVQFENFENSKNLKRILADERILKIFHYGRFDIMMIYKYLEVMTRNVYCTKIASKLVRTYTSKHSLLDLCQELLGVSISKEQTCTDWGSKTLTEEQQKYAATDVLYLHRLKEKLDRMLEREGRVELAKKCFDFLGSRCLFDLMAGENYDIFSHSA